MLEETIVGNLEDEAHKRKERLKAMKRKAGQNGVENYNSEQNDDEHEPQEKKIELPKPKFRSYKPIDEALQVGVLPQAKPGDVESEVQEQLEAANARVVLDQLDVTTLAPRKPDWDLKRDIAKKLDKLERRTQRAMAELIRDRLKAGQTDLATAVSLEPTPITES